MGGLIAVAVGLTTAGLMAIAQAQTPAPLKIAVMDGFSGVYGDLTAGEVERLIEAASTNRQGQRDALMTLLAFRHGLQAAEVCDLRWEQIDPQQCMSAASRTARPPLIR